MPSARVEAANVRRVGAHMIQTAKHVECLLESHALSNGRKEQTDSKLQGLHSGRCPEIGSASGRGGITASDARGPIDLEGCSLARPTGAAENSPAATAVTSRRLAACACSHTCVVPAPCRRRSEPHPSAGAVGSTRRRPPRSSQEGPVQHDPHNVCQTCHKLSCCPRALAAGRRT